MLNNGLRDQRLRIAILAVTLFAVAGSLAIPVPASWPVGWEAFRLPLAFCAIMSCTYIAAAALFISALEEYKAKLRHAYVMMVMAIVANAVGMVQLALLNAFDLMQSPWVKTGGVILPFLASSLLLYVGSRNFGRLVGAKSIATNTWLVAVSSVVFALLSTFLPHISGRPEIEVDASNAILVWSTTLSVAAALLILEAHNRAGDHYKNALAWLFVALCGSIVVLLVSIFGALVATSTVGMMDIIINGMAAFSGVLYVKAGFAFFRTKEY